MTQALNVQTDADVAKAHTHMHMHKELEGADLLINALAPQPFGAGFTEEEMLDAVKMQVWVTLFDHPSPTDFTIFELYDIEGNRIAFKQVDGY